MISIQKIHFPPGCDVINNDFYTYDPLNSFNKSDSIKYLNEDLFQCKFPDDNVIIDLGWYGDFESNKGEFKIQIIQSENWEIPLNVSYSKSVEETKDLLINILHYYSNVEIKDEEILND